MQHLINTSELKSTLPKIIKGVKRGEKFVVKYKNQPVFLIIPLEDNQNLPPLADDPLFNAGAFGASSDGLTADDHDTVLYGATR